MEIFQFSSYATLFLSWGNLVADVKDRVGHTRLKFSLEMNMKDIILSVFSDLGSN